MVVLAAFAGLALLMAAVGLYGVLAFSVAERTREIGIRVALGADSGDVLGLVVGRGLALAGAGTAIGLAAALALTRLLSGLLFDVTPGDPVTFADIAVLLLAVATLATWLPARRAAALDPVEALRS
ncbi:MAG: FtsX-like permease family protein [Longimicrobiales bacterium]